MKKLIGLVFVLGILGIGFVTHAQMMGSTTTSTSADTAQTMKDEAEGKAVWDKLQDKQVTCKDLTDDDYDVLGDFFMGNMAGTNHASMNEMMSERLGDAGEKQMHIAMGKRLSGCNTNAALPSGASYFTPMMGMNNTGGDRDSFSWGNFKVGMMEHRNDSNGRGGSLGTLWMIGWLFSIGYLGLTFWKGVLALLIWPYYLGKKFTKHDSL